MAIVTREIYNSGDAAVSITFNDQNGSLNNVSWTVDRGTLHVLIKQQGQPDIDQTLTSSGSINPPAGFNLVRGVHNDWVFRDTISYEFNWHN
jgi:hypothetical protein